MSGTSYTSICPECEEKTLMCYSDYKPHDIADGVCVHCGFYYTTKTGKLTKEQLKGEQRQYGYDPETEKFD